MSSRTADHPALPFAAIALLPLLLPPVFLAYTRAAVRDMVRSDYGEHVEAQLTGIGWRKPVGLYVEYRVYVLNDGTFVASVPRMTALAAWFANPTPNTGYSTDIFPDPWQEDVPLNSLLSEVARQRTSCRVRPPRVSGAFPQQLTAVCQQVGNERPSLHAEILLSSNPSSAARRASSRFICDSSPGPRAALTASCSRVLRESRLAVDPRNLLDPANPPIAISLDCRGVLVLHGVVIKVPSSDRSPNKALQLPGRRRAAVAPPLGGPAGAARSSLPCVP